jgi:putative transposase
MGMLGSRHESKTPSRPAAQQETSSLGGAAPGLLTRLRDEQPSGEMHYRFWQRGGGYDRNITELATLLSMIDYIHHNPARRGLVKPPTDWP